MTQERLSQGPRALEYGQADSKFVAFRGQSNYLGDLPKSWIEYIRACTHSFYIPATDGRIMEGTHSLSTSKFQENPSSFPWTELRKSTPFPLLSTSHCYNLPQTVLARP